MDAARAGERGRARADHLPHRLPRHPRLPADLPDRLPVLKAGATDLRYRLHHQHPELRSRLPREHDAPPVSGGPSRTPITPARGPSCTPVHLPRSKREHLLRMTGCKLLLYICNPSNPSSAPRTAGRLGSSPSSRVLRRDAIACPYSRHRQDGGTTAAARHRRRYCLCRMRSRLHSDPLNLEEDPVWPGASLSPAKSGAGWKSTCTDRVKTTSGGPAARRSERLRHACI